MKSFSAALFLMAATGVAFGQGTVSFYDSSSTTIRTNSIGLGGTADKTAPFASANQSQIFYYALFTAPSSVTSLAATDLLTPAWTFTGLYATNMPVAGRLNGGNNATTLQGWPAGVSNSYAIAGWSATVAGSDWNVVAAQLNGAVLNEGVWSGTNWQNSGVGGFFGVSTVAYGESGGGTTGWPPLPLFANGSPQGAPLNTGFDLYVISASAPTQTTPQFSMQPTNLTVRVGDTATFASQAYGTPSPAFQWQFNGTNISGATSSNLTLVNVQPTNGGTYSVLASNVAGVTPSSNAVLTVVSVPVITTQPQSLALDPGATATFWAVAYGPAPLSYQWRFNGTNITGASATNYSRANVQPSDAGLYTVVVTNNFGSVTSSVAILRVPPQGTVSFYNSMSTVIRTNSIGLGGSAGDTAPFAAGNMSQIFYYALFTAPPSVTNLNPADLLGPTWTFTGLYATNIPAAGRLNGGNEATPLQGWPAGVTNSYGIAGWSATVAGADWKAVAAQLNGAGFNQGVWYGTNWQNSSVGGFFGASTVAYGEAGGGATGLPPLPLFSAGSPQGAPLNSGFDLYVISASAPTQTTPQFSMQPTNLTVRVGDSATFASQAYGTPSPAFQWQFNGTDISGATSSNLTLVNVQPSDGGTYSVLASNVAGVTPSSNAVLTVVSVPVITTQPQSLALDPGATATFWVSAYGPAPLSYQWRFNGTNITGATATNYSRANVQPSDAGSYTVVVTNSFGSVTSSVAILRVPPQGTVGFYNSMNTVIRTNSIGIGGSAGNTAPFAAGNTSQIFYYALFTAPPSVTNFNPTDLLGPTWTFTGLYATNMPAAGRLTGGSEVTPLQGWPPQVTNSFVIAGWSSDVAGQNWSAVAAQLAGARVANGVWYGPNWLASSQAGFFGISPLGSGAAGGGPSGVPPFVLFGAGPEPAGTPLTNGFDLYAIRQVPGLSPVGMAQDGFHIILSGEAGSTYQVLATSNFSDWSPIGIVTNTDGQAYFTDPAATGSVRRYYRAQQLQ